jgi:hypothetical protein
MTDLTHADLVVGLAIVIGGLSDAIADVLIHLFGG